MAKEYNHRSSYRASAWLCDHPTAHTSDKTSTCSSIVFVACSCLSGG
jgi:hypothetical protein